MHREVTWIGLVALALAAGLAPGCGGASVDRETTISRLREAMTAELAQGDATALEDHNQLVEDVRDGNVFDGMRRAEVETQLGRGEDRVDVGVGLQRWFDWIDSDDPTPWQAGFQLLAHARREPAFAALYRRRYARYRAALTAILARGQSRGAIRDDIAADLLADQLSAMGDGWMMLLPIEPDRFRPARVRALLDATLTMIAPPDRGR